MAEATAKSREWLFSLSDLMMNDVFLGLEIEGHPKDSGLVRRVEKPEPQDRQGRKARLKDKPAVRVESLLPLFDIPERSLHPPLIHPVYDFANSDHFSPPKNRLQRYKYYVKYKK